ncbi:MAG: hypothetical protein QMD22_10100 [archaeon]|nr:hypothetical protein [archaeon]
MIKSLFSLKNKRRLLKSWDLLMSFFRVVAYTTLKLRLRTDNIDRALSIGERYLVSLDNPDLAIDEIMDFERNYYVVYYEKSTGIGAFEMLIDKDTGRIFPEYGPNMMWNTKYGHAGMMGGWALPPTAEMPVTQDEAISIVQEYLDRFLPGTVAEDPHPFYGYYTIHVTRNGEIYGMLSVNGYDGTVWYHNWHGTFIQSRELHEE